MPSHPRLTLVTATAVALAIATTAGQEGAPFRSAVDLVDVTVTVTDSDERFVAGLQKEDFTIFEDGVRQEVSYFSNERVPVSLGLALDTSGSMTPDKMGSARTAIGRFVDDLLGPDDELFYMQFASRPDLVMDWTTDRRAIKRAVGRAFPGGGTAMYDAIAEAVPLANTGRHRKKALLVISDGNDTASGTSVGELRQQIRESDVLVYALGIDGEYVPSRRPPTILLPPSLPFPFPGRRRQLAPQMPPFGGILRVPRRDGVNADALRQITDPTGGRTEILRGFDDLDGATERIADELSQQYQLAYERTGTDDGRWHTIRVEVRGRRVSVRARSGFVASAS